MPKASKPGLKPKKLKVSAPKQTPRMKKVMKAVIKAPKAPKVGKKKLPRSGKQGSKVDLGERSKSDEAYDHTTEA